MLYLYKIVVPLKYNTLELYTNTPETELMFYFEDVVEETVDYDFNKEDISKYDEFDIADKMRIRLHCDCHNDDHNVSNNIPNLIICEIEDIIASDDNPALIVTEKIIDKICKRLSFIVNRHNGNRHLCQPKIEADWSKLEINRHDLIYNGIMEKGLDQLEDKIHITESMHLTMCLRISANEINISEWLKDYDAGFDFVCNEYYTALGSENVKSKFFHLFSIIEFCEREYKSYNNAKELLKQMK